MCQLRRQWIVNNKPHNKKGKGQETKKIEKAKEMKNKNAKPILHLYFQTKQDFLNWWNLTRHPVNLDEPLKSNLYREKDNLQ